MLGRTALTATRVVARSQPKGQKRTFIDYLTNYPDRVSFDVAMVELDDGDASPFFCGIGRKHYFGTNPTDTTNGL